MKEGKSAGAVAKEMGLVEQTLRNWVKAFEAGTLNGAGTPKVSAEVMELSRLRAKAARLKRENDIRRKATGYFAREALKYAWIDAHRDKFALNELCLVLEVSVSGYRAWGRGGTPDRQGLTHAQWLVLIQSIHAELKGAYGSSRMVLELRARGFPVSKARVERLMREHGLRGRHKRRYKATTDPAPPGRGGACPCSVTSRPALRTRSGTPISPICGPMKAGCIWPSR